MRQQKQWLVIREPGGNAMIAIRGDEFIKASGSTIERGHIIGRVPHVEWGLSLLGKTQIKDNNNGHAQPTDRLAEFVLDLLGQVHYPKAKPRNYSKK